MLMATPAEARRWAAVLARDPAADGEFVYSVRTTGVYCRPSCAARRARPENIAFHETCAEAEAAGYRPCRRCRPDEPSRSERDAAVVTAVCRRIEAAEEVPTLAELARGVRLSPHYLHRLFKAATGVTPRAYAAARRDGRLREELSGETKVTSAIYEAGFGSSSRVYERAGQVLGMTPRRYSRGGETEQIRFAVGECSLGSVLVAATDKGVCAILLGDDPDRMVRDLQDRFSRAELVGGDEGFEQLVAKVVGLVERPELGLDLPLDVCGTAFQRRVWEALQAVRAGETATYSEIAARIGAPSAVRAVAQACAANNLAVAIPCHRVVRSDGALSGYAWGVERKQSLLRREAAA